MSLFRSVTVGLLGACLYFVVQLSSTEAEPPEVPIVETFNNVTVIDVAQAVDPMMIPALVELAPGEHITAIDDQPVANNLAAGALLARRIETAAHVHGLGRYIDITITGESSTRRLLVLLH